MIIDGRVVDVLVAIGNHEAKALTFLAMQPDVGYGISALHRLFLEIQGDPAAYRGTVNLQQKYAVHSYEPAGLAVARTGPTGHLEHVRHDPSGLATAVAGHLLGMSELHDASLVQILGKSASHGPGSGRAPARRLALLRALSVESGPTHASALARVTGDHQTIVGGHLTALARAGVVRFDTRPTYSMRSRYRVSRTVPFSTARGGSRRFYDAVVAALNLRLRSGGAPVEVDRDDLERELLADPRFAARDLRDVLTATLHLLAERGHLDTVHDFAGQTRHTSVSLDPEQLRFVRALVAGLDAIARGEPDAHERYQTAGQAIVRDPLRVRALIAKVFAANKVVTHPVTQQEKDDLVLARLAAGDGLTTAEIAADLAPALNEALALGTLVRLSARGLVQRERQSDGPYNRWHLPDAAR